jgi:hypothetical protein
MGKFIVALAWFLSFYAVVLGLLVSIVGIALTPSTALAQPAPSVPESDLNELYTGPPVK